jgi:hypothetical protein
LAKHLSLIAATNAASSNLIEASDLAMANP